MTYKSSVIHIGNIVVGGTTPVRIQSMTTTDTMNTLATVAQVKELVIAGCDFVRIATQNIKEAENLKLIKNELLNIGIEIPLIADVHYNPKVAEIAAQIVEKVRINPGNYVNNSKLYSEANASDDNKEYNEIEHNLVPLLNICKIHGTAIRIGVNHGSLSSRILYKYGNTALGMVESIMEFVVICHKNEFHNLVLSLKASNVATMIDANMLLVKRMKELGLCYPIHLGVTEAGSDEEARVKSSAGIGYLLAHGIGDTIRVSLTEDPLAEIPVAIKLVNYFGQKKNQVESIVHRIVQFPSKIFKVKPPVVITSGYSNLSDLSMENYQEYKQQTKDTNLLQVYKFSYAGIPYEDLIIKASVDVSILLISKNIEGVWIENQNMISPDNHAKLALNILQVLGARITKTEFVACPTCGRSTINVIKQLKKVKEKTSHLSGLKIAVMGCAVNGPGEMADAHYGFVGKGNNKVSIYKGKKVILKDIAQESATEGLIGLIKENGDWHDVSE